MGKPVDGSGITRRDFLGLAAAGGTLLATGTACRSRSGNPRQATEPAATADGKGRPTLRIAQWNNYIAGYDQWWNGEYTKQWGERNGVEVLVDHFDINQAPAHAEAEVASQRGHDLFHLNLTLAAPFEDHAIDHRDIVEEVQAKFGKAPPFVERSVYNPRTDKHFGFAPHWIANPVHYRTDLWEAIGAHPASWDDVLAGGRRLKADGYPVGIGMGPDSESNVILVGLLHAFGAAIQDEEGNVVLNSKPAVEAVKMGAAVFRSATADDVLNWDITSNNRYLVAGRGSLIVNSIAALRALEAQDPALAAKVGLLPAPAGPAGTFSPYVVSVYIIWKFAENQEAAKQFLVDLADASREVFIHSQGLHLPAFGGAMTDLAALLEADPQSQPPGKYTFLADAAEWTTNIGHPGHANAAVDEVVKASVISQMFATAARGEMTAEEAVRAAEARIKPIYDKWREQGKI